MRLLIVMALVLTAELSYGGECTIFDYEDHYEAVCEGDGTATPSSPATQQASVAERTVIRTEPDPWDETLTQQMAQEPATQQMAQEYWLATTPRR